MVSAFRGKAGVWSPQEMRWSERAPLSQLRGEEGEEKERRTLFSTPDLWESADTLPQTDPLLEPQ